jgi:hypothetical protein
LAATLFSFCQVPYAAAVSLNVNPPGSIDFGPVALFTSSSPITVTATAVLDAGYEPYSWSVSLTGTNYDLFPTTTDPAPNCTDITCVVDVRFFPTTTGSKSALLFFSFIEFNGTSYDFSNYRVPLTGLGVERTAAPLPAALPLFATGLGALGLLGWRRKRKAQGAG